MNLPHASNSFKTLNPHVFGQHQAEEGVQPIVERKRGGGASVSMAGEPYFREREYPQYDSKTEREFGLILEAMKQRGEILRYEYKGMTLRWFDMKYTPDFVVFDHPFGSEYNGIKMIEVKGAHIHYRQQAVARFKGARGFWPEFQFEMHQRQKDGWKRIY